MKMRQGIKHPIKMWTGDMLVEDEAMKQLMNISSMPFIHKHISVMPDVHFGRGATVGSVIPTKSAIIPAAVGVDIGCFTGDTTVILADSKSYKLEDLANSNKEFCVWSCLPEGKIVAAYATAKKTRSNATIIEIELDNGKIIKCTPDHEFLLRNGEYKSAENLSINESLMPFYSEFDEEGYYFIQQPHNKKWQRAHWTVALSDLIGYVPNFGNQKTIIHHIDFNRSNNTPENLMFMGDSDHSSYHRLIPENNTHWQSTEFEQKRLLGIQNYKNTPEGYSDYAKRGTDNILKYMEENYDIWKDSVKDNGNRGKKYLLEYNTSEKGKAKSKEISNRIITCEECGEQVKSHIGIYNHKKKYHQLLNHKVVAIRKTNIVSDVYCLIVPGYNNFALEAGVFVHNCGMCAVRLDGITASDLPDSLVDIRNDIEHAVPVGFAAHGEIDAGLKKAQGLIGDPNKFLAWLRDRHPKVGDRRKDSLEKIIGSQLGTLGGGNHFIELCLDTNNGVWLMLHSGSRGIGNIIGQYFIELAKNDCNQINIKLPDRDLAYLREGTDLFNDYVYAVDWCQKYAAANRADMLRRVLIVLHKHLPPFKDRTEAINCHHNYVARETHYGEDVWVTRKGAVNAEEGKLGIIPGSMGAKSFIVKGKGNIESFNSCSHGAGRKMSRGKAKEFITIEDHILATEGVECRKDAGVLDESPAAYKDIDEVMAAQSDLVDIVYTLKQILCVKG